jgi:hypothetical protein
LQISPRKIQYKLHEYQDDGEKPAAPPSNHKDA